jgi:hypothetical protein
MSLESDAGHEPDRVHCHHSSDKALISFPPFRPEIAKVYVHVAEARMLDAAESLRSDARVSSDRRGVPGAPELVQSLVGDLQLPGLCIPAQLVRVQ